MKGTRAADGAAGTVPPPTATVKVSDHDELDVWVVGSGTPIVLVHGGFFYYLLKPLAEALAKSGHQAIWYHRRGYRGKSTRPTDVPDQARDVVKILDHLGIDKAHVVGHSAGGPFVLSLATQAPDRLLSVALMDFALPGQVPSGKMLQEMSMPAFEKAQAGDPVGAAADWLAGLGGTKEHLEGAVPGIWSDMAKDAATWFQSDMPALSSWEPDQAKVGAIDFPVAWLSVSEFPPIRETGELLKKWLPGLTVLEVATDDHFFVVTAPEEAAAVLDGWIKSQDAAG